MAAGTGAGTTSGPGGYYGRTIAGLARRAQSVGMAKYSSLLGRRVHVEYRAGDVYLPATGTLAADTGKSVFLEEKFEKNGSVRSFRWEIPYPCIIRVTEITAPASEASEKFGGEAAQAGNSVPRFLPFKRRTEPV